MKKFPLLMEFGKWYVLPITFHENGTFLQYSVWQVFCITTGKFPCFIFETMFLCHHSSEKVACILLNIDVFLFIIVSRHIDLV